LTLNFPLLNASLNFTATVLLVAGYVLIRNRRERAHKVVMLTAFVVSILFLISYLAYHVWPIGAGPTKFPGTGAVRAAYYTMLVSHILLAMVVPVIASITIYLGLRDRRERHRQWARWTLPIWLYVSVTGVLIYVMLYHLYPQNVAGAIIH
jgi:uncharacterized membrane protein YozB (DUF420 family)